MKNKLKVLLGLMLSLCLMFSVACFGGSSDVSEQESTPESKVESALESNESLEESEIESIEESDEESEELSDEESEELSEEESEKLSEEESEEESESEDVPVDLYSIVFVDFDDSVISSEYYGIGATVVVPEDPTREDDETYTYEFAGWDSEVVVVDGDATYKATYTATYIDYTVTFVDEYGVTISSATYHYGDTVVAPAFPDVEPNNSGYNVYSWDKEVVAVDGDATYTRVVDFVYYEYTVIFLNEDGTELSSATYHYGDVVVEPETPSKEADNTYTYEFAGWDKEVETVVWDTTYTATYTEHYIDYTVRFLDADGTVLEEVTCHYGDELPEYDWNLSKEEDEYFTYEWAGWDKAIAPVTGDTDYVATYTATAKAGYSAHGASMQESALVLGKGKIGDGADYNKGAQAGGYVDQSYFAIDGEFGLNSFIAFDFTGKNMPEVAFFAKNYDNSMYANGISKQGVVVVTGVTTYDGKLESGVNENGTQLKFAHPFMIQEANANSFMHGGPVASQLGRANLVDGTHYRVVMGFVAGSGHGANGITLKWYLYNLDTNEVVEELTAGSYNFFTGSTAAVNNMSLNDLVGSVVLYGKFGTTTTIDKLHGVFNADYETVKNGVDKTFRVTFNNANGEQIDYIDGVKFGETVTFDGELPELEVKEDAYFVYSVVGWDKAFAPICGDTEYTLQVVATAKEGYSAYKASAQADTIVLGKGSIGDGANYILGQQAGGYVDQSYFAIDGNYGLNSYVAFDFTGKNMPEVAFFANNYNNSMYAEGTSKEGIVVVTGVTIWNGSEIAQIYAGKENGTYINYGFPYMIQNAADGGFCSGAFAASELGRANLVDGTHYRVIMGFTGSGNAITLNWYLYDLDTKAVVEESSMTTWNFFSGTNAQVGNKKISDLSGSIVLYGKFGTTCTLDKLHGVYQNTTITGVLDTLSGKVVTPTQTYNTTVEDGVITLGKGSIGNGANYTKGQNNAEGATVDQAYYGIDGNYALDNYIVFDFTGKNMPEVAFFANNYNSSMYAEGTSKTGIVVVTGVTAWDGKSTAQMTTTKPAGTYINYDFPYMIQDGASGSFCQGAFTDSALGRENLVDGKHYRVIMGFTGSGSTITLNWCLYDLDNKVIVEQSSMTTWGFFTGSNDKVGNMKIDDLSGSIVLYGKFGTTCTIDKLHGVESGSFGDIVAAYTA